MSNIFQGSGYDKVKIQSLLLEAQTAMHQLLTGTKAVKIERNGRKVEFKPTDKADLKLYIAELQGSLNLSTGIGRSPARVCF